MNLGIFKMFKLRGLWEAREGPSKIYGRTAFVTSLIVSEVPYSLLCATIYFVLWYFMGQSSSFLSQRGRANNLIPRSRLSPRRRHSSIQCVELLAVSKDLLTGPLTAFAMVQLFFFFMVPRHSSALPGA